MSKKYANEKFIYKDKLNRLEKIYNQGLTDFKGYNRPYLTSSTQRGVENLISKEYLEGLSDEDWIKKFEDTYNYFNEWYNPKNYENDLRDKEIYGGSMELIYDLMKELGFSFGGYDNYETMERIANMKASGDMEYKKELAKLKPKMIKDILSSFNELQNIKIKIMDKIERSEEIKSAAAKNNYGVSKKYSKKAKSKRQQIRRERLRETKLVSNKKFMKNYNK